MPEKVMFILTHQTTTKVHIEFITGLNLYQQMSRKKLMCGAQG